MELPGSNAKAVLFLFIRKAKRCRVSSWGRGPIGVKPKGYWHRPAAFFALAAALYLDPYITGMAAWRIGVAVFGRSTHQGLEGITGVAEGGRFEGSTVAQGERVNFEAEVSARYAGQMIL